MNGEDRRDGTILFVAPLPPPLGGFSFINSCMLTELSAWGSLKLFNRSPPSHSPSGQIGRMASAVQAVKLLLPFLRQLSSSRAKVIYLAMSGGLGQVLDALFLLPAAIARKKILIHHHSFAYLHPAAYGTRLLLSLIPSANHIVLCSEMKARLIKYHGTLESRIHIVSNAAFIDVNSGSCTTPRVHGDGSKLVMGLLSNLTREKGLFKLLTMFEQLSKQDTSLRLILGGPIELQIEAEFNSRLTQLKEVARYRGPIYGSDKWEFFRQIDVFVFPSEYRNEADPVVLWEALSVGVPVITTDRGCCSCIVDEGCALVSKFDSPYLDVQDFLLRLKESALGQEMKALATKRFQDEQLRAKKALSDLRCAVEI